MENLASRNRIRIVVNESVVEVYEGMTILQALLQEDIHIPHLCNDIRLERSNGSCGLCVVELKEAEGLREVKACQTPVCQGMDITTNSARLEGYRKVRLEQMLADHNADCVAPCAETCPANVDIQLYLRHVADGNFAAALEVIKDRNPFPVVCGRVCPHPCEDQCRRGLVDAPVAINHVKRFVADWDMEKDISWSPKKKPATGKKIAVVGAGPSGLAAAYYSAIQGHDITVFERQPYAGGMMRYGIPEYRLPKKLLDKEIHTITSLGVKIMTEKALGQHIQLAELQREFDAVYLAIGSWCATPMKLEGEQAPGVWLGIQYLEQVTKGVELVLGDTVVVGGGNTAIDCARTALRKGASSVKLVYRRTREEMPAESYEVEEALHEGVDMLFLMAPEKIETAGSKKLLHCIKMKLGEPDQSGRRRPVPIEGSEVILEADTIIGAIGQSTDTAFLKQGLSIKLNKWKDIEVKSESLQTSVPNVFAGGDCVTGPATVIQAVAAGRRAAETMDSFIMKGYIPKQNTDYSCNRGSLEELPRGEFEQLPQLPRRAMPAISLAERKDNFDEVELGYSRQVAQSEAARCLECGCTSRYGCELRQEAGKHGVEYKKPVHERPYISMKEEHPFIVRDHNKCISCGRCITACTEVEGADILSFYIQQGRQIVGTRSGLPLDETDCVSCGQCVNACPCGALSIRSEKDKVFQAINNSNKMVVGFVAPAVRSLVSSQFAVPADEASAFTAGILKKLGFDKVFDFSFAADLTVVEETTEFLNREQKAGRLPQFTSCCPGWVNFVERRYPQIIPHLSTCKSPQQMMGATVKNHFAKSLGMNKEDLYVVSIVPCIAKKYEAARPEFAPGGIRDVDAVLTSNEMLEMLKRKRIPAEEIIAVEFDEPYKRVSGAGVLFGASGGVAEAALRMAVERLTGQLLAEQLDFKEIRGFAGTKEATVEALGKKVRVAVISGLNNVEPLIEKLVEGEDIGYDLIEVMACPGGCICGAGHPIPKKAGLLEGRQQVLVDIDKTSEYRKSQENPDLLNLYSDFYGTANSQLAHELLHTHYAPKNKKSRR